ncbi:TPA: SUF system NifU family Fe-S cluster assembly protein [Candidatus Latescibacteria bacterium]|nr:SUF system NifU family Fe-S cluster assembly protein [Candidatus Latescibacterota bacterium]|tara:strand:+ start:1787 stop:2224 length:438 start_codon:yes stop_codon:yes gene_type:complete
MHTRELYQQFILDHNRSPRNFRAIEGASGHAEGNNPLCGDTVTVDLTMDGETIVDVAFQGTGCAISTASASLMTELVKGMSKDEALSLFDRFRDLVTGTTDAEVSEKLSVFASLKDYPTRVKCATLAWHTLKAALEGSQETITTE